MNKNSYFAVLLLFGYFNSVIVPVYASGITVYKEGNKYVKLGGRIQLQYHSVDPESGSKTDDAF